MGKDNEEAMKVTLYSPDGTAMEEVEALGLIPVCSHSGFVSVVLEDAEPSEKIMGGWSEAVLQHEPPRDCRGCRVFGKGTRR